MRFAIPVFPGSNCDIDMFHAVQDALGEEAELLWHSTSNLDDFDGILLPGGFSYGDYLRCGAISRFSNIMEAVHRANDAGKPIIGICNGFQILTEAHLLPGALLRNKDLKFICDTVELSVENNETIFTGLYEKGETIRIPIAHGEGNYYCDEQTLASLEANRQIVFRYKDNPNGSLSSIAGIVNEKGNVLGMMPHPERAVEALLGNADGLKLFKSIVLSHKQLV